MKFSMFIHDVLKCEHSIKSYQAELFLLLLVFQMSILQENGTTLKEKTFFIILKSSHLKQGII